MLYKEDDRRRSQSNGRDERKEDGSEIDSMYCFSRRAANAAALKGSVKTGSARDNDFM